ncbi:MAG: poly-gamma-glutamate synthase PgsB [Firmicutes bacterium]|nr:poly-gamma-glutamate synthase PgsB [Bacillota bacterium]
MPTALAAAGAALWMGRWWLEWHHHQVRLAQIPLRIHVNGTRGKSTVTRLIAAGLRYAGRITVAKTTGSAARFIYPDGSEIPWPRRGNPNIREQLAVVQRAHTLRAQALVLECMALKPEIQWVAERIFPAQITVITNLRPDHTDVFPKLEDYARALSLTIPTNGFVITTPGPHVNLFRAEAKKKASQLQVIKPTDIATWGELATIHHQENLDLASAALRLAGVPAETARAGMAQAHPDPGAFTIYYNPKAAGGSYLANAFAANDPVSTQELLQRLFPPPAHLKPIILYNHRPDRLQRARDFQPLLTHLAAEGISIYSLGARRPPLTGIKHLGMAKPEVLLHKLGSGPFLLMGIGNIEGAGYELCQYFARGGTKIWKPP